MSPALKAAITNAFSCGFSFPCTMPTLTPGSATELVGSRLGRLDVQRVAFLNGRAHPVGLTTVSAGGPDASDHGLAACAVNQVVVTGCLPGGSSSMMEQSRSP